jgi:hypothetical protein
VDRTIRKANTFSEADAFDREDVALLTFSERLAAGTVKRA